MDQSEDKHNIDNIDVSHVQQQEQSHQGQQQNNFHEEQLNDNQDRNDEIQNSNSQSQSQNDFVQERIIEEEKKYKTSQTIGLNQDQQEHQNGNGNEERKEQSSSEMEDLTQQNFENEQINQVRDQHINNNQVDEDLEIEDVAAHAAAGGVENQINNQDQNEQQLQQQDEQEIDEEEQANAAQNPAQQYTRMISTMNNEPFLNEETLAGIYELLHLNSPEMFDEIERYHENWKQSVELILKKRLEIYNKKVELISNIYQQNIPNNSMHNIEKIMSIIKSKDKEIYIYKIDKQSHCCHHEHHNHNHHQEEKNQSEAQGDLQQEQQQQQQQQANERGTNEEVIEEQCLEQNCNDFNHRHHHQGENEIEEQEQKRETDDQAEDCVEQKDNSIHDKGQNEEGNEIAAAQETIEISNQNEDNQENKTLTKDVQTEEQGVDDVKEQERKLVEENQRLKREYQEMVQKNEQVKREYEYKVHHQNYHLRQEAAANLQRIQQLKQAQQQVAQENSQLESTTNEELTNNNEISNNDDSQIKSNVTEGVQTIHPQSQQVEEQKEEPFDQEIKESNEEEEQQHRENHNNPHHHHHSYNQNDDQQNAHSDHHHHIHNHDNQHQDNNQNHEQSEQEQERNNENSRMEDNQNGFNNPLKLLGQNFSINDIQSILQMQFVDLQRLKKLNPVENSITFDMNDNYLIKIKSCESIKYDNTSLCSKIPHFIFKEHIFPFLSSVELFRVRSVSPEWRELVREVWHKTFKRDMQEQLLATDLCKEIEAQFKLMHIRNPFFSKLDILIRAMVEVINWEDFERKCLENRLNYAEKKVIVALLRIIGYNFFDYENINQFEEEHFARHNVDISLHLKEFLIESIKYNGMSSLELKSIYNNFLTQADVSISMFRNDSDKNFIIFILIAKQYFIYSLLRNYITNSRQYMQFAKTKLDTLSKDWPTSKGFLEGAYRILLLRNVSIKNGQIVNNDSEDGNDTKILTQRKKKSVNKKTKKPKVKKQENNEQKSSQQELNQQQQQEHQSLKVDQKNEQGQSVEVLNEQSNEKVEIQEQQSQDKVQNFYATLLNGPNTQQQQEYSESRIGEQPKMDITEAELKELNQNKIEPENSNIPKIQQIQSNHEEEIQNKSEEEIEIKDEQTEKNNKEEGEVKQEGNLDVEEEDDDEGEEEEQEEEEDEEQSQAELTQLMRSIFNLQKTESQEPDIVIKRKTGIMKIFLDQGTKLDIILNTVISVGMQNMQREIHRETSDLVQDSKKTLENLEQRFNENQQQIEEMKQKSQELERHLIEKQAQLEQVQIQNQQLQQEFQENAQEIQNLQSSISEQEDQIKTIEEDTQNNEDNDNNLE